jgi:hypothetical protein
MKPTDPEFRAKLQAAIDLHTQLFKDLETIRIKATQGALSEEDWAFSKSAIEDSSEHFRQLLDILDL